MAKVPISGIRTTPPLNHLHQGWCGLWGSKPLFGIVDLQNKSRCAFRASRLYPYFSIIADIQLHNRADLLHELRLDKQQFYELDNSEVVIAAYEKWGEECATHLLGEFSFAIWDERRSHLFCCRDQIGFRAFLYWHNRSQFIFSDNLSRILEIPDVGLELNRKKLAGFAVPGGQHFYHRETYHKGIFSLPAGACMRVDRVGLHERQYWEPKAGAGVHLPNRSDDMLEQLRELLFRSVECRLDSRAPAATRLSGGLDSSAVTAIAARCMAKQNRELTAVSAIIPNASKRYVADETEYINEFCNWPNIRIKYVTAGARGPFDFLDQRKSPSTRPQIPAISFLNEECEKVAAATGAAALLDGSGGEFGITSWSERFYLEMAVTFHWVTLFRELNDLHAVRGVSRLRTLARPTVNIFHPWRNFRIRAFLTQDFLRECRAEPRKRSYSPFDCHDQEESIRYFLRKRTLKGQSGEAAIETRYPLLDKRLLEYCMALPSGLRVRNGYQRYPIRGALKGILPERIRLRTTKTPYSPDYFIRYNSQLPFAMEFVSGIRNNDPIRSIVDVPALQRALAPVDPVRGTIDALHTTPATLYMISFLRQFPEFRI